MATPFHARAVKSLNKSPGRRRFVFKTKSQQIEDIDINVFRSLDKIKAEPSEGSSFFRDCLIEWRELNTAEDFISFYEEMMPFVQTLPLVLLHKELIFSKLQSRLQMKARLSLEPILRLMAAFSRDLLEDFTPFLPRLVATIVTLLNSGGDKEPEIVEQIFMSLSYTMMYLQKYLMQDIVYVLKVTQKLRYYPKDYVQEFMAEAVSFLLRNAPDELFTKCVKKIMLEVVKKPLVRIKSGVTALLFYIMRGISMTLHSKAGRAFKLVMGDSIFVIGDKLKRGSAIVDVVIAALERLCQELESKELDLMWKCLYKKINDSATKKSLLHLSRLLSFLISVLKIEKGCKVSDYEVVLECVDFLVRAFIAAPSDTMEVDGHLSKVVDKVLRLMSCILDGLQSSNNISTISVCSLQWAPAFQLRNSSLLTFIEELIQKDHYILDAFRVNVLSALNDLIDSSEKEVIGLLLTLCERLWGNSQSSKILDNTSGGLSRIHECLQQGILNWTRAIKDIIGGNSLSSHIDEARLAVLWGMISCYPHMFDVQADSSLLIDLMDALNRFLAIEADDLAGIPRSTWQSLFGAALNSLYRCHFDKNAENGETVKVVDFAKAYKSCPQVLSAVADYLDNLQGPPLQADGSMKVYHPELKAEKAMHALDIFSENLSHSDRQMRVATLRILCQYEPLGDDTFAGHQPVEKKMKTEGSQACHAGSNVLELFLSIEATPLSISTSRKVILLISRVQMDLSAGRISETYIPLVLNGLIGIFHNRFSYLWNPACECLGVLIKEHTGLVWDKFIDYLGRFQASFLISNGQMDGSAAALSDKSIGLLERFNSFVCPPSDSTPSATVLSSLLQSLQKVPLVAESKCAQIIPLFLKFLGYNANDLRGCSVGSFNSHACRGKGWKGVFKEWLNLLKHMRNVKSFNSSLFVKDVLQNRLLDDSDAEIQMLVLECLLMWKDNFLVPYDQHLNNLINPKPLREEITTWSLSRESCQVEEGHRAHLVPLVIRLLMPKIRKLKTLASRKHASMHNRRAVLAFIAQVDVDELPLFFVLLMKPLLITSKDSVDLFYVTGSSMGEFQAFNFLKYFTVENITSLPWKKRYGFMHVIQHILEVFDELHARPFLDLLMGCVVRVLVSCTRNLDAAKDDASAIIDISSHGEDNTLMNHSLTTTMVKQLKELRSLCLKIFSFVLNKYEDHDFGCELWNLFFTSVEPLIKGFKQEGSSSEKPSSLFSCFLAMSRSHELVTLLHREKNLVPDIFSILTVSTASEAIKCYVLKFIENLLNLDKELDDDDTAVKSILLPNLEALICSLHCLFQHDNASKRKSHKYLGGNEVRIFKLLSKYIKDPLQARTFIDILLPFLAKRVEDSDACPQALEVIQDMIPTLGIESTAKILNAVSPLLVTVSPDVRFCICDLLDTLAKVDSSVLSVAKLIRELNSTSKMEVDGLDDDAIINTYERIDVQFFITIGEEHTSVILSQCVFDMSSEELVLRQSAYSIVLSFIEFCVLMLGQENGRQYESGEMGTFDGNRWTRACILRLINKCLLKHIGDAMSQGNSVKKEWIDILRDMVLKLPDDANFSSFKALCSDDAEIDFFYNIVHLQKHRRARALLRFKNIISKTKLPEGIVKNVFAPLFFSMLLDLKDGKDEHVRAACMEALASVCVHMEWKSYYALLSRCFREMRKNANKQKVLVRLVCAVLDQFHFSQPVSSQAGEEFLVGVSADNMNEIRSCLHKTLLPKIQKLMTSDTDSINVNISLAAVKILKLLPGNIMDTQLPTVTNKICNSLKSRSENIRDEARTALAACLKELGLEYLQYVVKVLRATLKRGYELHVLGYTLYFILSKYLMNHSGGSLDYCLEDLISVVENDILGEVAEEKEVEKIASKMKETKKCKSFESLKLIAQNITFKSHALKLLTPVKAHLQKHLTPKVKTKLESMLDHIAAGIELNPSVEQTDLFTFIYGLLEDGIKEENVLAENSLISGSEKDQANKKTIPKARVIITRSVGSHLITVFALALLHNRVKNAKLDKNDIWLLSMLDPFIKPLGNCLSSQYENILSLSLRCLSLLVRLPLPSLASLGDKIKVTLLDIAQSSINSSSPLMQSCLKLLTVLLQSTKITLSSDQLHLLIQFPIFDDLEKNTSFVALSLLKAIVKRKLVVHEIYDLMTRVAELMVTSQVESIRKKCSQILLQFLLDYRLSRKRLEEHLSTLLANLRYEHSSGRETVLEMLCAIVMKFPKSIIDEHSLTFFIHLVFCLVNDRDTKVRSMIGATIKLLTGRISSHSLNSILDYVLPLYSFEQHKEKPQLCGAAAQVLGLLIEVMRGNFQRHVDPILVVVGWILHSAVDVGLHQEQDCSDEVTLPFWNDAYYSLVMLEKLLYQFRDLCFKRELEGIWEEISKLLLHPHLWLCNRSNRLLALYFTTVTEVIRENAENSFGTFVLLKPAKIFMIVISLCCQLKAQVTDDDVVNNLLTQNIAFAISSLPSSMQQNGSVEPHKLWSALEQHEQAQLLKAFQSLDPGKGRGIFLALISGMYGQNDNEQFKDPQNFLISYLLKRMGKLSLEMGAIQMKIVFNIFKTLSLQLSPDNCHIYAFQMLLPVYKVSEGFAGKVVSDDLKQLAQEVRESIRNTLGIQTFVQIYQEIRKSLKAKRDKRKHEEKVMAVVNPMRNAKRKLRIAAKHCANKKRKIMTMKMARWMH